MKQENNVIKKNRLIIAAALIAVIVIGAMMYNVACDEMEYINASMSSAMSTIENKYLRNQKLNELIDELRVQKQKAADYLEKEANINESAYAGTGDIFSGLSKNYTFIVADSKSRKVLLSSDEELTGQVISTDLRPSKLRIDSNVKCKDDTVVQGFTKLNGKGVYCTQRKAEKYIVSVSCSCGQMFRIVLNRIIPTAIVFLGMLVLIIGFLFKIIGDQEELADRKTVIRSVSGLVMFSAIVFVLFNAHFCQFSSYSLQNTLSTQNMKLLSESMSECEKSRNLAENLLCKTLSDEAETINEKMNNDPGWCTHEELKNVAEKCSFDEISIYDASGIQIVSSDEYHGYKLTEDISNPRHEANKVLTSDQESVFTDFNDESGRYMFACKRFDEPGVICIIFRKDAFTELIKRCSVEEAIRTTDFGNATVYYVKLGDNEKTYKIEPFGSDVTVSAQDMPKKVEQDHYSGICTLSGEDYYVCSKKEAGVSVVSAIETRKVHEGITGNILFGLVVAVLTMMVILYSCRNLPSERVEEADELDPNVAEKKPSLFKDSLFRRTIRYELYVLLAGYAAMLFKKTMEGETLLQFLLYGKWDKGFNIFAVNASVIYGAVIIIAAFLLKKLIVYIGHNAGQKALTICHITASMVQFAAVLVAIGHALYQFGMDASALLASAGVAGIVIGIAARGIFEDLIAGLFLVFEGNIHVGDFVSFNDFRGEVAEIGARVSIIQRYHRKLVVNNAELRQYYRLSDALGSAWVEICIGPNEDLDAVKDLIKNSSEWYQSRDPNLKDGPFFCNVADFNSSGITICLCGVCTDERSSSSSRKIRYNTIELFRENGITLGKSLVKLELSEEEKKHLIDEAIMEQG